MYTKPALVVVCMRHEVNSLAGYARKEPRMRPAKMASVCTYGAAPGARTDQECATGFRNRAGCPHACRYCVWYADLRHNVREDDVKNEEQEEMRCLKKSKKALNDDALGKVFERAVGIFHVQIDGNLADVMQECGIGRASGPDFSLCCLFFRLHAGG